jgi:hypothetical protein
MSRTTKKSPKRVARKAAPAHKRGGKAGLIVQKGHPHTRVSGPKKTRVTVELPEIVATPKTKTAAKASSPLEAQYAESFEAWKNGAQISALVAKTGLARPKLRRELIVRAGGVAGFKALRAEGAGGKAEPFGGKRATGGAPRATLVAANDKKVPVIDGMPRSKGWTTRRLWRPKHVVVKDVGTIEAREQVGTVHIAPDGIEYVECRTSAEPADLRVPSNLFPGEFFRFRRFESSPVAKKLAHHEREVAKGEKLLEHRAKVKRTKREARKATKPARRK